MCLSFLLFRCYFEDIPLEISFHIEIFDSTWLPLAPILVQKGGCKNQSCTRMSGWKFAKWWATGETEEKTTQYKFCFNAVTISIWLSQWLTFKLSRTTYLIGKIRFKLFFHVPLAEQEMDISFQQNILLLMAEILHRLGCTKPYYR